MADTKLKPIEFLGDYINGQFVKPDRADGEFKDISPGNLKDEVMHLEYRYDHVSMATEAAHKAFLPWARLSNDERASYLRRLKEIYLAHKEQIAEVI